MAFDFLTPQSQMGFYGVVDRIIKFPADTQRCDTAWQSADGTIQPLASCSIPRMGGLVQMKILP